MPANQSDSQGFVNDSHLNLFLRNAWINRDYQGGVQDKAEWGQGIVATFESGYTEGLIGFGVDGIAQYGVRLDGGPWPQWRRRYRLLQTRQRRSREIRPSKIWRNRQKCASPTPS
ncbi:Porin D precursor [Citrobacter koseri]|uniref:Porin D n=1 Tax=Citrobacter koseri TaxID=545 RepID=A0A2X2WBE8_CITKO|nr:Porin D precursor [Citrobacter koseri]